MVLLGAVIGVVAAVLAGPAKRVRPALATPGTAPAPATAPGTAPDGHALLARFIERSQRFRRNGAIVGIVLMVAGKVVVDATARHPSEDAIDLVVLATIGLAGSIGGSMVAEAFRLRRPEGPRVASLAPRDASDYQDAEADRRERAVVLLAALGIVGATVSGTGLGPAVLITAVVVALALLRRWAIRGIAFRPRPALSPQLATADERVRRLAASVGISRPVITLGALLVSRQWFAVVPADAERSGAADTVGDIAQLGAIALFVVACVWWWANRSFGLTAEELRSGVGPKSNLGTVLAALVVALIASAALVALARGF